jgi:hypothetical protein
MLGRLPDPDGFDAYINHMKNGVRRSAIISSIACSAEYYSNGAAWLYEGTELLEIWDDGFERNLSVFTNLMPKRLRYEIDNIRYQDVVYMDRINDRFAKINS